MGLMVDLLPFDTKVYSLLCMLFGLFRSILVKDNLRSDQLIFSPNDFFKMFE